MPTTDAAAQNRAAIPGATLLVSLELSRSRWLVTSLSPGSAKLSSHTVAGGDGNALLDHLAHLRSKAARRVGEPVEIVVIQEAGLDGFWIHRLLVANGIESHVVEPASIAVPRRHRRTKTDTIDGETLVRTLAAFKRGEPRVCSMVVPPSPAEEDRRRLSRERRTLIKERVEHSNRIKGLLASQPLREGTRREGLAMRGLRLCLIGLLIIGTWLPESFAQEASKPPNIVFVLSDDEDLSIHPFLPNVKRLIEDEGTTFNNMFVAYPLCGPSRSSILRGQYPHNTEVLGNLPPEGGFAVFRGLKREQSTVATWLQAAGYRTAFYGKYLNGYTELDPPPPGWDEWHAANNDGYFNFNYKLNENGKIVAYGDAPEDYLTDVIRDKALAHMRRFAAEGRPFFLYVATFAPHGPYVPAPRHAGLFKDAELPRPASFNEADVSDKPTFIRELPLLEAADIDKITAHHRSRLDCLQAVDELVESLIQELDALGELDNTFIVYASDNGFHLGLHRMQEGKDTAYEEDIRVPLAIRGPGVPKGRRIDAMVLNIDLAPTFAGIAGAPLPDFVDGRSLLPLLEDPNAPWRQSLIVRRLGLETDERLKPASAIAIRTEHWTFVGYHDGEHELYDLVADPNQLENRSESADPALVEALSSRLIQLKACAGETCRAFEDAPVAE